MTAVRRLRSPPGCQIRSSRSPKPGLAERTCSVKRDPPPGLNTRVVTDTETGEVVGWVAALAVSARPVYAGVVEHSVYVHPGCQAHGIGRALLAAFIATPGGQAGFGFRVVGTRERIGRHHGVWHDVIFIERRSTAAGN